jgi:four helix bundle protein
MLTDLMNEDTLIKEISMLGYKNLEAWKKAMLLVSEVYALTASFPKQEQYGITSQAQRAAVSIPCNIAEGCGRQYKRDTRQFLHIARGSLYELDTILNIAVVINILAAEKYAHIVLLLEENAKIINGLISRYEREDLR